MEGTETYQAAPSPFAGGFSGLTPVTDNSTAVALDADAPTGTTEQTTAAPEGTIEQTTDAPTTGAEGAEGDDTPPSIIDTLRTQYGVDDVLDNSIEGVQTLIEKVTAKAKEDAFKAKYEANPVLGQLDAHLAAGKSLESFFEVKQVEAQKITLPPLTGDEKNDAQVKQYYKNVITAQHKALGLSDKQINRMIEMAELENSLEEDAKEAATGWNGRVDVQAQQITVQEEQQRLAAIEADKQMVVQINQLVDAGKLNGAIIPQADRQPLKDFMLKVDEKGFTPRDYAFSKLTLEQQAIIDYLVFKDFKLKGFVAPPPATDLNQLRGDNKMLNNNSGGSNNAADTKPLPAFDFGRLNKQ